MARDEAEPVKVILFCLGDKNPRPIERRSNFTKGFYARCVKVKEAGKVKVVLRRLTQLDCL